MRRRAFRVVYAAFVPVAAAAAYLAGVHRRCPWWARPLAELVWLAPRGVSVAGYWLLRRVAAPAWLCELEGHEPMELTTHQAGAAATLRACGRCGHVDDFKVYDKARYPRPKEVSSA